MVYHTYKMYGNMLMSLLNSLTWKKEHINQQNGFVRERMDHFNWYYVSECVCEWKFVRFDKENCHSNSTTFIIISKVNQNNRYWLAFFRSLSHSLTIAFYSCSCSCYCSSCRRVQISNWNSGASMRFPIVHRSLTMTEFRLHGNRSKWASANTCRKLK